MDKQKWLRGVLWYAALAVLLLVGVSTAPAGARDAATDHAVPLITQLSSDATGLTFRLNVARYDVDSHGAVTADGLDQLTAEPGAPAVPYYSTLIALPPEATAQVTVQPLNQSEQPVAHAVRPAPRGAWDASQLVGAFAAPTTGVGEVVYNPDPAVYGANSLYPGQTYAVSEPMYDRDVRLVRLDLFPLRYNPATGVMAHTRQMDVRVTFSGAQWTDLHPVPGRDAHIRALDGTVLNVEHVQAWRSLPQELNAPETVLPIGIDTYKIEVNEDGIYEMSRQDLANAGMNVGAVDPRTFEMMYRGEPVAYQFNGDGDSNFEANETIRFYGWRFDGSRLERQFIPEDKNYFWLWAGGTPTLVDTANNPNGHPVATSFRESMTREEEVFFQFTHTDDWDTFPNEPDAWYWKDIVKPANSAPMTVTNVITLPHPAGSGADALVTAELLTRRTAGHEATVYLNDATTYAGMLSWTGVRSVNVTATVPSTAVLDGANEVNTVISTSDNTAPRHYFLNRVTVAYQRQFIAVGDQLIFGDTDGPHTFNIQGVSEGQPGNILVWDVSDRRLPRQVPGVTVTGSNPYTLTFGSAISTSTFIATTKANQLSPLAITQYTPPSLTPAGNQAEWLAITHPDFIDEVEDLAAHRADSAFGGLTTQIVEIDDVINQYGYGFPIPAAIHDYLAAALANWSVPPGYVLLVGDTNINPRDLECPPDLGTSCYTFVDPHEPRFVLTDLLFADRFQGLIPSDHTFVLLSGDDLIPDMAIGRLPVRTAAEAGDVVQKIVQYETNHLAPQAWQKNIMFVADNTDSAGNFCLINGNVGQLIPDSFTQHHLCLPDDPTPQDVEDLQQAMWDLVNPGEAGVTVLNYRGHGSTIDWGGNPAPIMEVTMTNWWLNFAKPPVILSMDCLDGYFALPGQPTLGETFLKLDNGRGSAAHWSSSGLGYTHEHTVLHEAFYVGLFDQGQTALGDAINYAKLIYAQSPFHESELYSFTLQGDPGMQLMRPDLGVDKSAQVNNVEPGQPITYSLEIANSSLYPTEATITDSLPAGLSYVAATADVPISTAVNGNTVTITLDQALAWNDTASIELVTLLDGNYSGNSIANTASIAGNGIELDENNNESSATVFIKNATSSVYLPAITRD